MPKLKVAIIQIAVSKNKLQNISAVEDYLQHIEKEKVHMAVLPEMFNCPYDPSNFPVYAEEEGGACWQLLSKLAGCFKIYLVAGSMPESDSCGHIYNTSYVFDRQGKQIAKHRKVHLFDIDVEGGQYFKESDTLVPGSEVTTFDTDFGKLGLCICYDIRFPEMFRLMVNEGAKLVIVPAAFNMTTGPAHWELLFRTRAVDNQVYMIGAAPARDSEASYISWGHYIIIDPWGKMIAQMDEREGYIIQELDLAQVINVRKELPLLEHRRKDLYRVENLKKV